MKTQNNMKQHHGLETGFDILAFLAMFLLTVEPALWAIGMLIFADTLTGIWKTVYKFGWEAFDSRKLGRVLAKIILYPLALLLAYDCEHILAPSIPWLYVTMGIIAMVEVKSIFENIGIILGYDLWQKIKDAIWKAKKDEDEKTN